jgi:hypothetical protein
VRIDGGGGRLKSNNCTVNREPVRTMRFAVLRMRATRGRQQP